MLVTSAASFNRLSLNLHSTCSYHKRKKMRIDPEIELIARAFFPREFVLNNEKILHFNDLSKVADEESFQNLKEIRQLFIRANNKNPQAMYELALCYFTGRGLETDYNEGVLWLKKAAEEKYPAAVNDMGRIRMGFGQDSRPFGVSQIFLAASMGCLDAKMNLGLCYEAGIGVRKDLKKALQHYKDAAALGSLTAANEVRRFELLYSNRE